jgi:hypothetical protein
MTKRLIPDGQCWCGCGAEVPLGKFFAPGHDRRAIQRVIVAEYGSAVQFLVRSGYAPGGAKWKPIGQGKRPSTKNTPAQATVEQSGEPSDNPAFARYSADVLSKLGASRRKAR